MSWTRRRISAGRVAAGQVTVAMIAVAGLLVWLVAGLVQDNLLGVGAGMLCALGVDGGLAVLVADRWGPDDGSLPRARRRLLWVLVAATAAGAVLWFMFEAIGSSQAPVSALLAASVATSTCVYSAVCLIAPNAEGAVLSQRGPGSTEYYLRDRLDSTIGLISGTSIVRDYTYDPDGNADSTGSGATTNIRFAGGHTVRGLYHYGARYYDPNTARWTQPDPLVQAGDLRQANRYAYVGCNPVNRTDPTGTFIDFSLEEAIWNAVDTLAGFGVCALGTIAASAVGTPAAGVAAGVLCWTGAITNAAVLAIDMAGEDPRWAPRQLITP